jgi:hypothetical protein
VVAGARTDVAPGTGSGDEVAHPASSISDSNAVRTIMARL